MTQIAFDAANVSGQDDPLRNTATMVRMISAVTGRSESDVLNRLRAEYLSPCSLVAEDFRSRGYTPYEWGQPMIDFYCSTDAFLFELALWNRNRIKRRMRHWTVRYLESLPGKQRVLCFGDGMGFDSLAFAKAGHKVSYFELPGLSASFARLLFQQSGASVTQFSSEDQIETEAYDVIQCLDVLEHVPNPSELLKKMVGWLKPGGTMLVHAPFYMIHPTNPTHLKSNRRYSGSLALFEACGLIPVGGHALWTPLALRKPDPAKPGSVQRRVSLSQRLGQLYYTLGRCCGLVCGPVVLYRRMETRWFDESIPR